MKKYDCVIIGAGVAGLTAAIYLKRLNIEVLIIEASTPGGQIINTSIIENYPGFTQIDGASLAIKIYEQVENLKIPYLNEKVLKIENNHRVITKNKTIDTDYIIIATGRTPKKLKLNLDKYIGKGVSFCAVCDGMFYKNKNVVVVGGGNSALEESIYLSKIVNKLTILNRKDKLSADNILKERVENIDNIEIKYNCEIEEVIEKDNVINAIKLNNNETLKTDGIFIFIGLEPKLDFINIENENNYVLVNKNMQTNIENIYAVGDAIKKDVYQITTALGEASIAAVNIAKKINERR